MNMIRDTRPWRRVSRGRPLSSTDEGRPHLTPSNESGSHMASTSSEAFVGLKHLHPVRIRNELGQYLGFG
jgi:hypothetical protein